jgi:hypothetical protein
MFSGTGKPRSPLIEPQSQLRRTRLENVGDVIASRDLTLDNEQRVKVLIGKPERLPGYDDWY